MLGNRLGEVKLFVLTCTGLAFFFTNDSIAMMKAIDEEDLTVTELALTSGGKVFQAVDETIQRAEKKYFSSLVYRVGSTGESVSEIETYCEEKISRYSELAKAEIDSPYIAISQKWLARQTKALADITALRAFYQETDAKIRLFINLLNNPPLPKGGILKKKGPEDIMNDIEKLKTQKRQVDALFHYCNPYHENGNVSWWNSMCRKIDRRIKEKSFCRPKPDLTIPDRSYGEDFYNIYNAIVPQHMQVARPAIFINVVKGQETKLTAVKSETDLYSSDDADNLSYERQYVSDGCDEYEDDENS